MKFLNKLERKYGRFGIPNLMIYITATMLAVFVLDFVLQVDVYGFLAFNRAAVLRGEVWRLITFVFLPTNNSPIWIFISLYFYYFIGSTLENTWGSFRFTAYYLLGIIGTIIGGFLVGGAVNDYLNLSLFFAFAQLYPDHEILLFFVLPVKMKYLAYLNWALFAISFLFGGLVIKVSIVFSLVNFFIFFGPDLVSGLRNKIKYSKSRREFKKQMRDNNDIWR